MDGIGVEEILRLKGLNPSHDSSVSWLGLGGWRGSIMCLVVVVVVRCDGMIKLVFPAACALRIIMIQIPIVWMGTDLGGMI